MAECSAPLVQRNIMRFNLTPHPSLGRVNDQNVTGLLYQARHLVMEHFKKDEFSSTAAFLYYTLISYYSAGRGRPQGLTPEDIARAANVYAAKVLLRGKKEDGSARYPPVAGLPSLTPGAIKAFDLTNAQRCGLLN
ncbi:hypothetical protein FRC07_009989 [Ceratobasidium sp. 392]|nr:hypothetical protein FRC07_009989 [Ceratobasidium sp. 392]